MDVWPDQQATAVPHRGDHAHGVPDWDPVLRGGDVGVSAAGESEEEAGEGGYKRGTPVSAGLASAELVTAAIWVTVVLCLFKALYLFDVRLVYVRIPQYCIL